jgi:DnaK suppressor protein
MISSPSAILFVTSRRYISSGAGGRFLSRLARRHGPHLEKLKNYRPSEKEPFMNERQREYFRRKLLDWKEEILRESKTTLQQLQEENVNHPDLADRASSETDRAIELRARDRQRKLISKIDAALQRIEDNTYGYCEETGEPISLKRLEARPIATLSVEAQERHEKREKVYRDE